MNIATNSKMFAIRNSYINKRRQSLQYLSCLQYNLECIPFMQALLILEIIHHLLYKIQSNNVPLYSCSRIL
uniref:Uncharacterized protein n=1 Tax=Lotus japonicus TaxID=34305 RepID=I3SSN8_LOTJA|nr:unknown [Lotus japonicus]